MEVLFEYKGSKRTIRCDATELCDCVCGELNTLGITGASIGYAHESGKAFILQQFSSKWNTFIDVGKAEDVSNGDRVTVIPRPVGATQTVITL